MRDMSSEAVLNILHKIREPIADYQEARGLSKAEKYSFINLITSLCQHAYNAAVTIFTMLYNLLPLMEGFTYLLRFILDKLIDIVETTETHDRILKAAIFVGELLVLTFLLFFIISILLIPVVELTFHFIGKVFGIAIRSSE